MHEKWIVIIIIVDITKHLYVPGRNPPPNHRRQLVLLPQFIGEESTT